MQIAFNGGGKSDTPFFAEHVATRLCFSCVLELDIVYFCVRFPLFHVPTLDHWSCKSLIFHTPFFQDHTWNLIKILESAKFLQPSYL